MFEKIFSIHGGVVESVPKPRKRDGNLPYLRVVTLHVQIALFPEKTISTFPENPPRILLRMSNVPTVLHLVSKYKNRVSHIQTLSKKKIN